MAAKNFHYETNPISIIISGFKNAFAHSQQLAIMLIVVPFVLGMVSFVGQIFMSVFEAALNTDRNPSGSFVAVSVVLFVLMVALSIFAQILYVGFQAFALIKMSRGEDETFGKALEQVFAKFWQVVGVHLMLFIYTLPYFLALSAVVVAAISLGMLSTLALAISLPVCILLGVFLIVMIARVYLRFAFAVNYVFEGAHSLNSAFEKSKQLTKGRLGEVFGVTTISAMVPVVNALASTSGMAVLFRQLTDARAAKAELPKQHLLNYLVPAIAFVFIGFVMLIFLAIYAATDAA